MGAQSQQLDDHLHGENHGEDHVEDVHDGGEELGLLVMLDEKKGQRSEAVGASAHGGRERREAAIPARPA